MFYRLIFAVDVESDQTLPELEEAYAVQNDAFTWQDARCTEIQAIEEDDPDR